MNLLRHGFTSLRRSPTLALTIIATLGIALAAGVVVFSFLNSFLLRPLPYGDASRLLVVYEHSLKNGKAASSRITAGNAVDLMERATSFSRTGLLRNESVTVHARDTTEVAFIQRVTPDVFPMLGLRAGRGAVISRANFETGGLRAALLSDALWRRRFGGDPGIVGRTVQLDDKNYAVVGVMPADFRIPTVDQDPQAWLALLPGDFDRNERSQRRHHVWAELTPGRSVGAALGELEALGTALRGEHPAENGDRGLTGVTLRDDLLGDFGRQLVLLQGAVVLVLVVACFNCLCLLIARAIQRRREFAVRLALGAARRHLLAQLFVESLWLAVPAAVLACGLAELVLPLGTALLPPAGPGVALASLPAPHVDFTVAATVTLAALAVAAVFSAVPLLQTRRLNLEAELRQGGRSAGSPSGARLARLLASGQIAVALALLICAALLLRSQQNLSSFDPGFAIDELDMFRVGLRGTTYSDPAKRLVFYERVIDGLRTLPGVKDVTAVNFFTTQPPAGYQGFVQEGDGLQISDTPKRGMQRLVMPNFFSVFGLKIVEGRPLEETDVEGKPLVAVISASLAAKYWPGQSPIGKRVKLENTRFGWVEIVGVASDYLSLGNQPQPLDGFFMTIAQVPPPGVGLGFVVRHGQSTGGRGSVTLDERLLQRVVWAVDPNQQFFLHQSPAQQYALSVWQTRFVAELAAAFALLAVALALAGIYAVNSFFVANRTGEFGIRSALGATPRAILALVLRDSFRLTAIGLAGGLVIAFAASRGLTALLYAVPTVDLLVYLAAAGVMTLACAAAALVPARRAAKVDPLTALRAE